MITVLSGFLTMLRDAGNLGVVVTFGPVGLMVLGGIIIMDILNRSRGLLYP